MKMGALLGYYKCVAQLHINNKAIPSGNPVSGPSWVQNCMQAGGFNYYTIIIQLAIKTISTDMATYMRYAVCELLFLCFRYVSAANILWVWFFFNLIDRTIYMHLVYKLAFINWHSCVPCCIGAQAGVNLVVVEHKTWYIHPQEWTLNLLLIFLEEYIIWHLIQVNTLLWYYNSCILFLASWN